MPRPREAVHVGLVELVSQELHVTVRVGAPATPGGRALARRGPVPPGRRGARRPPRLVAVSHQLEACAPDLGGRHRGEVALQRHLDVRRGTRRPAGSDSRDATGTSAGTVCASWPHAGSPPRAGRRRRRSRGRGCRAPSRQRRAPPADVRTRARPRGRDAVHFEPGVGLSGIRLTCTSVPAEQLARAGRRARPGR